MPNLTYGQSYNLVATPSTGYSFTSWNAGSYGTIANTSAASTTYTVGAGASTITPTATINKYSLTITFAGSGVSSVQVRTASGTGGTLMGTVSSSGGSVSNLVYGTSYYLYPSYSSNYGLDKWAKTDSATGSSLSSTSAANPTYKIGAGNGAVTITGKQLCQSSISGNMQDFNPCSSISTTSGTLTDSRDSQKYTVAKIGSQWFMTKNLAIGCNGGASGYGSSVSSKSLTSSNSNVSTTWSTPTNLLTTAAYSSSTSGYTTAAMMCNNTYGAWYNYVAATAGTISGSSNETAASKDICPKGWRLPTSGEFSAITSSASAFSPVTGGYYRNGSLFVTGFGYWWSSTADGATDRYGLFYDGSSLNTNINIRYLGFYVRCVKS